MDKAKITEEYDKEKLEALNGDDEYVIGYDLALSLFKEQQGVLKDPTPWISVNDRLPEKRKAVLAYAPRYNNIWTVVLKDNGWHILAPVGSKYDPDWDGPITHWMPLPKPPEEVKQDE